MTAAGRNSRGGVWRALAGVLLVAFALQSYFLQTHIHNPASQTAIHTLVSASGHKGAPADSSPECPFCQAVTQAGALLLPPTPILLLPGLLVELTAPPAPLQAISLTRARNWHSRAPPSSR